jgi:hypothetical protein
MRIAEALLMAMFAQDPRAAAPFSAMEKALRDPDESAFQAAWHSAGFSRNLVGGSGLSGRDVFDQAARKKWFPKPDLSKAAALEDGKALIVPCEIWSWERSKAVDRVDFLLVLEKDAYRVLGGGEKRPEVEALARRWLKGGPLE